MIASLGRRMLRAALLDAQLYEEVEADPGSFAEATAVVLLSAAGAGIGSFENGGVAGIFACAAVWLVGWVVWAFTTCQIGTRLLAAPETHANVGELLRTLGFASAPGVLLVFAAIDALAAPLFLFCGLWMLAAMVVALRQALDYSSLLRALAVCAVGFPIFALLVAVSLLWLGPWPL